jgi:hypothetical protein
MKTWVRKTLSVGVLAAGALLFAPGGAAQADARQHNGDNNGILNGTQLVTGVNVPVNVVGNSLGILGEANSRGLGVNNTESGWGGGQRNGDNNGIANGTQAYLPISVPLNVVGNSAAVLGQAGATGVGVNGRQESAKTTEGGWWPGGGGHQFNGDNNGIGNGTQVYAPVDIPVNVCGNSLALLGGAYSQALCANNVTTFRGKGGQWRKESAKVTESGWQSNGDNNGILNGTQLYAPVNLPVNLAGNSVAVLGQAGSRAVAVNESGHDDGFVQRNGDNNGILNGTQLAAPISIPVNVCGNSLGILGGAFSQAACVNNADFGGGDRGWDGNGWDGDDWDGGNGGHGHGGHGHGHHPGGNAGDNGAVDPDDDDSYKGDKGDKGDKPAHNNGGYGDDKGAEPDSNDDDGYKGAEPDATGSKSTSKGGRDKSLTEGTPVESITSAVSGDGLGGLGLLNTLR